MLIVRQVCLPDNFGLYERKRRGGDAVDIFDVAIVVIIVVFSFVFNTAGKNGKRAKNRMGTKQTAARTKGSTISTADKRNKGAQPAVQKQTVSAAKTKEGADPCHEYMLSPMEQQMHYESRSTEEMAEAGEGEDPCHVGSAPESKPVSERINAINPPELSPVARAVIMSEVLKRPSQRRQEKRMRHRKAIYG